MFSRLQNLIVVMLCLLLLSACGGGGTKDDSSNSITARADNHDIPPEFEGEVNGNTRSYVAADGAFKQNCWLQA